ncbi:MAG: hypothetical protein EPO65_07170 [Dehalococcoidia bacterium]|nr:MAG: hypothetical protein EPO65_07170 [Dehalococcoidia bacterium]
MHRASRLILIVGCLATLLIGCRTERDTATVPRRDRPTAGAPRAFLMGFTDTPAALTPDAYTATFDLASNYGEIILVQRAVAWSDFVPGSKPSDALREQTLRARGAASERGLTLAMAIDPFDPAARGRLQGLPQKYAGKTLADADLRKAFVADAAFVARTAKPAYLALGLEVNTTFERNPDGYRAFIEAYKEAYDAVKAASPETKVFPGFQYEELLGILPDLPPHPPRWQLLEAYGAKMDLLAITTYPSFVYEVARKIPPGYYLDITKQTKLPVAFLSAGFSAAPGRDNLNSSTPPEQRRYLQRLIEDADALASPFLIWYAGRDPGFAQSPPFDLLGSLGLRDSHDQAKEAWGVWEAATNRPYDPQTPPRTPTPAATVAP